MTDTRASLFAGEPAESRNRMNVGFNTFCGISSTSELYCWGNDILTDEPLLRPKLIDKGPWSQVGVGLRFLCALKTDDKNVYCYGRGYDGQLGDGSPIGKESVLKKLTPIVGAKEFDSLAVGTWHSCAISDGNAFCWGQNDYGQLGTGNNESSSTPMPVFSDLGNWREVSAGSGHTCATKTNDEGWCWGHNQYKQVSPQSEEVTLIPSKLEGKWKTISAGEDFTLGIDSLGGGFGWGLSEVLDFDLAYGGLLGDNGTLLCQPTADGYCERTVAADSEEEEFSANDYDYTYDIQVRYETPVPIAGTNKWTSITAGRIPCAIESETNKLYCWGYTTGEAYADGSPQKNYPVLVNTTGTWASISSGGSGSRCGIKSDGTGWCWGRDEYDCENACPLGDGTLLNSATPVQVVDVPNWLGQSGAPPPSPSPVEPAAAPAPEGRITSTPPSPGVPASAARSIFRHVPWAFCALPMVLYATVL